MLITPIACLQDNYAYLLTDDTSEEAVVVDPSEAAPINEALQRAGKKLTAMWITHHHRDHVGGISELLQTFSDAQVVGYGPDRHRVPHLSQPKEDRETFEAFGALVEVLHIPGHTVGAIAYRVAAPGGNAVFAGDTLFGAGCGRMFEGTSEQMLHSLRNVLGGLSLSTHVYFGHEYTEANLRFASQVEPGNESIQRRVRQTQVLRRGGQPTTPTTLADEKATNPFLRCDNSEVRSFVGAEQATPDAEVFRRLRVIKDTFI